LAIGTGGLGSLARPTASLKGAAMGRPPSRKLADEATYIAWRDTFRENIGNNPTARAAWRRIKSAGLGYPAGILLWWFFANTGLIEEHCASVRRLRPALRAAVRADRVAHERRNDPRALRIFNRRALEAYISAYDNEEVPADLPLLVAPRAMAKHGERLRRWGTKIYLAILKQYLSKRGVKVGAKTLASLAACANHSGRELDAGTLANFLRSTAGTSAEWVHEFEEFMQTPAVVEKDRIYRARS
jgi:hypothetical protein